MITVRKIVEYFLAAQKKVTRVVAAGGRVVYVPELEGRDAADIERNRVATVVKDLVQKIQRDREAVFRNLLQQEQQRAEEAQSQAEDMNRVEIVSDPMSKLASALYETWKSDSEWMAKDGKEIEVCNGYCQHEIHEWFRVEGNIEIIQDIRHVYLIDPAARGVFLVDPQVLKEVRLGDILIVAPGSPFHQSYAQMDSRRS